MQTRPIAIPLEAIGITLPLTPTGMPSVTAQILNDLEHPVAKKINELRKANKIRNTFVNSIREHQTNGRIHTTFRLIKGAGDDGEDSEAEGAAFGRLASADPNLQQQPSKKPWAKPWRSIYIPDDGGLWC